MKNLSMKLSIPAILLLSISSLQGNTIKEVVEFTMGNNPKVSSILKNNEAYRLYIDEAKGGYYPKIDLTTYAGIKRSFENPDSGDNVDSRSDGLNAQLDFEQLIYDGGLTTGMVNEAQYRYTSNRYANDSIINDIIFDSIDSYLNLVRYKSRLLVSENGLSIYGTYLKTADDTQDITGETLQISEVNSKIHYERNQMHEDQKNRLRAVSSFKKNVGIEPDGKSCRPNLDESKIPATLKELIDLAIVKSPSILEQIENIEEQRSILNQEGATFYPTLKFKAQALYDEDLDEAYQTSRVYTAKIELAYNIFNGNQDKVSKARERVFLEEAQKTLDTVTNEVIDQITTAYNTYQYSKKRIEELRAYMIDNRKILAGYKDQFEGGTRTFIDVLNVERDLVSAKRELLEAQYDLDSSYFEIFKYLGNIEEVVLSSNNDECTQTKPKLNFPVIEESTKKMDVSEDVKDMLSTPKEETMVSDNGSYVLYLVAYKDPSKSQNDLLKAKSLLGDEYTLSLVESRGYTSVAVRNIATKKELNDVKNSLSESFPGAYGIKLSK